MTDRSRPAGAAPETTARSEVSLPQSAYQRLLDALRDHGSTVKTRGNNSAMAQCPAHEDRIASLKVTGIEGSVLLHCHANCHIDDVLAALNLSTRDLYDDPRGAVYHYDTGRTVIRTPDKKFRQTGTENPPELYRLAKVKAAVAAGQTVFVAEGEKDCHALETLGVVATTGPQGAGNIDKVDLSPLAEANVVLIPDQDKAGARWLDYLLGGLGPGGRQHRRWHTQVRQRPGRPHRRRAHP